MSEPLLQLWELLTPLDKWLCAAIIFPVASMYARLILWTTYKANTNGIPHIQAAVEGMQKEVHDLVVVLKTKVEDGKL